MPSRKRGRPRKFQKKLFLEKIRSGSSRKDACEQMGVTYKTLEYHLNRDGRFGAIISKAERDAYEASDDYKKFLEGFEKKHGVSFSSAMSMDTEVWFEASQYHSKELTDFDVYLKHLGVRNPRTWWPAVRKLREWYKWNPEKREFIKVAFLLDQTTFRWKLRGAPPLSEVEAWIEKVDAQFEEYKQDTAFHDYTESLDPCEKRSIIEEIRNQFKAMKDQEIRLCRENMKQNPQ